MTARNHAGRYMRTKFGSYSRNEKGLATWVKVLIGVMIVGTISIVAILGTVSWFIWSAAKELADPAKVRATVDTIAKFEDPLPTGWKFTMALPLGPMSVAILSNDKADINITLLKMPSGGKEMTTDMVVGDYSEKGVPTVPNVTGAAPKPSSPISIQNKGKVTVAGEEMAYAVGLSKNSGPKFSQFIGCVMPKSGQSVIIVQGQCTKSEEYPLQETKTLLNSIKSF
jgi:hypothetical protein